MTHNISHITHNLFTNSLSLLDLIGQADWTVKTILFILLITSLFSWKIIFTKIFAIKKQNNNIKNFERTIWSGQVLDHIYDDAIKKQYENNTIISIFITGIKEFRESKRRANQKTYTQNIYTAMQAELDTNINTLEEDVAWLATIAAAAPFIGLFGTVLGIMHSFQLIAITQNTTLVAIAPSIAEALLATAAGLIVAIPAAIFYNQLSARLNSLVTRLQNFTTKLQNILIKEF